MMDHPEIVKALSYLGVDLAKEISDVSLIVDVEKNSEIVKEGQYIKYIPIVVLTIIHIGK